MHFLSRSDQVNKKNNIDSKPTYEMENIKKNSKKSSSNLSLFYRLHPATIKIYQKFRPSSFAIYTFC